LVLNFDFFSDKEFNKAVEKPDFGLFVFVLVKFIAGIKRYLLYAVVIIDFNKVLMKNHWLFFVHF
jgi:hypothetical protein